MTVLVCFTFLLNALVEKATRTLDQRDRFELGSPERCRTNLEVFSRNRIIKFASVWCRHLSFWPQSIHGNPAYVHLSVVQGFCVHGHQNHPPDHLCKMPKFWKFKINLWRAPWRVMWSLTTMSQIDPVSGSPLMKRPLQLFHEVQYVWNIFKRQTWQDQCTL